MLLAGIKNNRLIKQLLKFSVVGLLGVSTHYLSFTLLFIFLEINYLISGVISFLLTILVVFYPNKKWTFSSQKRKISDFLLFFLVNLFGMILYVMAYYYVNQKLGLNPFVAQLPAIVMSASSNFFIQKFVVFKE